MIKYWTIFRVELESIMAFRGPAFVWMLFDLLWIAVFPFIWFLIIEQSGGEINGWSGSAIIMYYVFMAVFSNIVFMHPEAHMAQEIYSGKFSNFIIRPHNYVAYVFLHEAAYKVVRFVLFIPFFIPLLWVIIHTEGLGAIASQLPFVALAVILAIPLLFLFGFAVGMTSFWLEDAYVARTLFWASTGLFGGQYAPFELMPRALNAIASVLPFKYIVYFPLRLISHPVPAPEIFHGLMMQLIWIGIISLITFWVWKRGLRAYSAVGR